MNKKQNQEKILVDFLNKLKKSISNQDWNNTVDICEQIISICSGKLLETAPEKIQPEKYAILGDFLLNKGKVGGALAYYDYATNLKHQLASHYEILGKKYLEKRQFTLAFDYFNKALENDSKSSELYGNLGTLYVNIKQYEQAIAHYQQAIKLNPKLTAVYRNLSRLYNQIGNKKEANDYWYQGFIIEHNLYTASKSYRLGKQFLNNGKIEQAILCYDRFLELKDDFLSDNSSENIIILFQEIGLFFYKNQKYQQAIESYNIAIEVSKKLGDITDELINQYRETIKNNPSASAQDYFELGKLLRSQNKADDAIDSWLKSIKLSPDFKRSYICLQYEKIDNCQREKIINVYRELIEKNHNNELIWGNLADMLTVDNNLKEAINCYQTSSYLKSIKKNPQLSKLSWPSQKQKGPNFLIIGTGKGGTSSLYNYIGFHPQVLLPHKKELNFFDHYYEYGVDWYLAHFPSITDNSEYITGEASPSYFSSTGAESNIYHLFPEVKLIILLRNPVEKVISGYYHHANRGKSVKPLEQAIKQRLKPIDHLSEEQMMQLFISKKHGLIDFLYYYHLKRWLQYFPQEQFLIIKSEDFFENTGEIVQQVYQFLELPEYQLTNYPKANVGYYPSVSDEIKEYVANYCRPHNRKLEDLLGRDLNWG